MKKIYITKVQKNMFLVLTLTVVLPLLFIGIVTLRQTGSEMTTKDREQIGAEVQRVHSILFDLTISAYTASESMFPTNAAMHLFATEEVTPEVIQETETIGQYMSNYYLSTASCSGMAIYTNNPNVPQNGYIHYLGDYSAEDWYEALDGAYASWSYLLPPDAGEGDAKELCLIRRIAVPSRVWSAYLVIRMDNNYLRNIMGSTAYEVDTLVGGEAFYASDINHTGERIELPLAEAAGEPMRVEESRTELLAQRSFTPYRTDSVLTIFVRDTAGPLHLQNVYRMYTLLLLIALAVPVIIIGLFSRSFSHRIEVLRNAMRSVRDGNYEIITEVEGDDELTETFRDLKLTVQRIHQQEKDFYETRLHEQELVNEQQQMEFRMLASQINPHFLYNTLEMIRMQALAGGNREVAYSIKLLGKTMHYVLENTGSSLTTLEKELDYVTAYLEIQKLRFGDRFTYEIDAAEDVDAEEVKVLPLTIQPIVENAVAHGLRDVEEGGLVRITISRDDGQLILCVADNGPGMDRETLEKVRRNISDHDSTTGSIGLYNINRRVQLLYGKQAGVTVDSWPGRGTVVTLVIPDDFEVLKI